MINLCEKGLENDMLNIELIRNLEKQEEFLLTKINESLNNELIEFKDSKYYDYIRDYDYSDFEYLK